MNLSQCKYALFLLLLFGLLDASALYAQQSSSTSTIAQSQASSTPATTPLNKWFIEGAGGGAFAPGLDYGQYLTSAWNVMGGGGIRFGSRLTLPGEISYYHAALPTPVIQTMQQRGGSYSFLTYSVDPTFYFIRGDRYGYFVVGGGGYSHVTTRFDQPVGTLDCSIYSGLGYSNLGNFCNGTLTGSSYSSNQAMYNFGIGMEARLYPNHREILFAQGRYIKMMTPANQLPGQDFALVSISAGLRW